MHEVTRTPHRRTVPFRTGVGALFAALVLAGCNEAPPATDDGGQRSAAAGEDAARGPEAPDFALPDLRGGTVRLSDQRGKVVLVDFWATWCGPCRMEIPHLKEIYARYRERGFELVGISLDQAGPEVVRRFVEKNELPYPIVMGDEETAGRYGGITAIPTAFLIDRDGRVVRKYVGYKPLETFVQDIEPLL